ncbi:hypothetical protein GGP41_007006 [Bipolaris sorokiniana]|nr:hypothetical protein GGP41_007006 [Bipolaris sorokiniana]
MDTEAQLALPQSLETLWDEKDIHESGTINAKADSPMRHSLETSNGLCTIGAVRAVSDTRLASPVTKDASGRPSPQTLVDHSEIDPFQALPKRPRAFSESDAKEAEGNLSSRSTWLPSDIIIRDFACIQLTSSSDSKTPLPTPFQLAIRRRRSQPLDFTRHIVPLPTTIKLKRIIENKSAHATALPDLSPKYVGKHPAPYIMPSLTDLEKILHPTLIDAILLSDYADDFPNRCFCSLVLHEIQCKLPTMRLDLHSPRNHQHLQTQLRCILSKNTIVLDKLLGLYGDALRLHAHARINSRPMVLDTWNEFVGLLIEDVFMLPRHPIFDQIDELERLERAVEVGPDDEFFVDSTGVRAGLRKSIEKGRRKIRVFKYKGDKRVVRSRGRRWDFTS